jgi:hypothetical protein
VLGLAFDAGWEVAFEVDVDLEVAFEVDLDFESAFEADVDLVEDWAGGFEPVLDDLVGFAGPLSTAAVSAATKASSCSRTARLRLRVSRRFSESTIPWSVEGPPINMSIHSDLKITYRASQ